MKPWMRVQERRVLATVSERALQVRPDALEELRRRCRASLIADGCIESAITLEEWTERDASIRMTMVHIVGMSYRWVPVWRYLWSRRDELRAEWSWRFRRPFIRAYWRLRG